MNTSRIRTGHPRGEVPANTRSDLNWIHEHEEELLNQYGESMILVFEQKVIGVGNTYVEMVENAERNLSPEVSVATPVTYFLHHRQPFFRVRATQE